MALYTASGACCQVLPLESTARNTRDYARIAESLDAFRDLRMDAETIQTALTAHRELGQKGQHRVPIPDLLIAACAQQH
ncbi:MAG TPA: hypothetical protein VN845_04480 [Solirubrobacteraceae bacterium]|nr:hypothetical protein [Solirubrobacteraceae bacterium]